MAIIGIIIAIFGFIYGMVIIIMKFLSPDVNAGYSSIMAVMLFMFGVLFFFLGIIGEYVGRIYISLNKAPQYVVKEYNDSENLRSAEEND